MKIRLITKPYEFATMLQEIQSARVIGIDTETTSLDPHAATLLLLSLFFNDTAYVIDFTLLPIQRLKLLKDTLEDTRVLKVGQNITYDWKILYHNARIEMQCMHDVMVVDRMIYAGLHYRHDLKSIVLRRMNVDIEKDIRKTFIDWTPDTPFTAQQIEYAGMDAVYPVQLYTLQMQDIKEYALERIYRLEMAILAPTAMMEYTGIKINRGMIEAMIQPFQRFVSIADKALQDLFITHGAAETILFTKDGYSALNTASSSQVAQALARIGIAVKNSAGKLSLDSKVVQRWDMLQKRKQKYKDWDIDYHALIDDDEVADAIDLYLGIDNPFLRAYTFLNGARKLLSTYIYGIIDAINPITKRVHPNFNSYGAESSGRYSSSGPNFQNIPKDKKLQVLGLGAYSLRKCIEADYGRKFIIADYSGIELLILAVLAEDDKLLDMILRGDIHTTVTIEVLGYAKITPENKKKHPHVLWRDGAKTMSYAIAYGTGGKNLSETLNISLASEGFKITIQQGEELIEKWYKLFPKTAAYLEAMGDAVQKNGYVTDVWGRRRTWDTSTFINKWKRLAARREGQNHGIQASSASMTKRAIELIWNRLDRKKARIVICVHDEIVVEAVDHYAAQAAQIVKECMEQALKEILPEVADIVGTYEGTSVAPAISERYDK